MKIVYNWLKEFLDVNALPDELASRLALSGTNIGGIEKGPHGTVIEILRKALRFLCRVASHLFVLALDVAGILGCNLNLLSDRNVFDALPSLGQAHQSFIGHTRAPQKLAQRAIPLERTAKHPAKPGRPDEASILRRCGTKAGRVVDRIMGT